MLEVKHLSSSYGRIQVLHEIDLNIQKGETVALVGANGAGKTTLLRTISGVQPATNGELVYKDLDITRLSSSRRVRLGIAQVPEGRQVFGPMSVEDNLHLGAFTRNRDELRTGLSKAYDMFPKLAKRRHQAAGTLSGGEQQMLAIARALMSSPRLLLLDEPSMGLAPIIVEQIFEAINTFRQDGITIFLVEQNAHKALAISDRGYVIESGQIVLSDNARDLLQNPKVKEAYLGI